jgi:hypothetical protein
MKAIAPLADLAAARERLDRAEGLQTATRIAADDLTVDLWLATWTDGADLAADARRLALMAAVTGGRVALAAAQAEVAAAQAELILAQDKVRLL